MKKDQYAIIVKNSNDDNIRTFVIKDFEEALDYIKNGPLTTSSYRIQILPMGPK